MNEDYKNHPEVNRVVNTIVDKMEAIYKDNFERCNKERALLGLPLFKTVQEFHDWLFDANK